MADPQLSSATAQSAIVAHMADVCRMTSLHLNIRSHGADWQLLRQLTMLEDLALQNNGRLAQCSAVLCCAVQSATVTACVA